VVAQPPQEEREKGDQQGDWERDQEREQGRTDRP